MKIKILFTFLTLLFCSSTLLLAQGTSEDMTEEKEKVIYEKSSGLGIIAKKLLTDYIGPTDNQPFDFQKWNGGMELGLRMPINDYFNLAFPFKASSVAIPESNRNVNILSLDAQGQFFPLQNDQIRFQPYLASGVGAVMEGGNDVSLAIPFALGTNIHINKRVDLNIEMSYRLGLKSDRNNYQLGIGFVYNLIEIKEKKPLPLPEVVEEIPEPFDHLQDSDGDGVPDIYDLSPNRQGLVELMGAPDSDGDGIPDHLDKCPYEAGPSENHGCPVEEEVVIVPEPDPEPIVIEIPEEVQEVLDIAMRDVQFDLGRATLRPESFTVLNQVADIMRDYPQYRLRIHGHTDNIGSAANNQRLSEQRARSCYEYLALRGVSTSRMSFVGFGESRPISNNDTAEGRAQNRRVEFQLYTDNNLNMNRTFPQQGFKVPTNIEESLPIDLINFNYLVNSNTLNLRGGPGTQFNILHTLSMGDIVRVLNKDNTDWWFVEFNDFKGYVFSKYLIADPFQDWAKTDYLTGSIPQCQNFNPTFDYEIDNFLSIKSKSKLDAVVRLMKIGTNRDECIRVVYIRSNDAFKMKNIPQGRYYLKIAYGNDYRYKVVGNQCMVRFAKNATYEKGNDILDFNLVRRADRIVGDRKFENWNIPSYEVILETVLSGDTSSAMKFDEISEDEFNR